MATPGDVAAALQARLGRPYWSAGPLTWGALAAAAPNVTVPNAPSAQRLAHLEVDGVVGPERWNAAWTMTIG
jgi:hypothetical protein